MKLLRRYFSLYVVTLIFFLLIDFLWLGVITPGFYFKQLGYIMRKDIYWVPAFLFYLLYSIGILVFAVIPALRKRTPTGALLYGSLYGLFCYTTYDLTNYATITGWPLVVTIVDIIWGTVLSGSVAAFGYIIGYRLIKLTFPNHIS